MAKIKITQKHIDKGEQGNWESCPIALAITEYLKDLGYEVDRISVGSEIIFEASNFKEKKGLSESCNISGNFPANKRVDWFIDRFDSGKPVKPFELSLPL